VLGPEQRCHGVWVVEFVEGDRKGDLVVEGLEGEEGAVRGHGRTGRTMPLDRLVASGLERAMDVVEGMAARLEECALGAPLEPYTKALGAEAGLPRLAERQNLH